MEGGREREKGRHRERDREKEKNTWRKRDREGGVEEQNVCIITPYSVFCRVLISSPRGWSWSWLIQLAEEVCSRGCLFNRCQVPYIGVLNQFRLTFWFTERSVNVVGSRALVPESPIGLLSTTSLSAELT